ncbi:hypothetical protein ABZY42_19755 [Streptomyces sp. NPDC006622]|uniref:hypothetical protein n=1 Tax=Streptomyces sp. NPDC006622 TaxID=3155459 RepID=UPI0033A443B9
MPPGPLRELKDLLYEAYLAAGAPSLDVVTALIAADDDAPGAPARDSVHRILSAPALPPSQADVVAVATVLAREARWDPADTVARARTLWVRAGTARPLGTPVGELTDPFAFEVHASIDTGTGAPTDADVGAPTDTSTGAPTGDLPLLPTYVGRAHDARLAEAVARAVGGRSTLAVLVAGSSTGKTRACWEAVRALPADWRSWHPADHPRPASFLRDAGRIGPRTVVWLDETELYLLPEEAGERVAGALRGMLHDPALAPVLVLGTIWPEHWQSLCAAAVPGRPDPHTEARRLLTGHGIEVPDAFTEEEMPALAAAAREDSRLAQALRNASERRITQYLAGVPVLMERVRTAPAPARALVLAAVELRTLGLGPDLPERLLTATAPAYLSAAQWDEAHQEGAAGWPDGFLAHLTRPARGVPGPLVPVRPRPGQTPLSETHYRLADYLWQTAADLRAPFADGPAAFARALLGRATDEELAVLSRSTPGQAAYFARLHREGRQTGKAVSWLTARLGRTNGRLWSIMICTELKKAASFWEALCWAEVLAEADHEPDALLDTLGTARVSGRLDQALEWIDDALASGHPSGRRYAEAGARQLLHEERLSDAAAYYRRAGPGLDLPFHLWWLVARLARQGHTGEAYDVLRPHLDAGDRTARWVAEELGLESG